jgi:radical SAM superfamily enzyme YgiQ (UPF0313 family)
MVNDFGINTLTYFIINHPTEKFDDMMKSVALIKELIRKCPLNTVFINTGFPFPGTDWWTFCEENNLLGQIDLYKYSYKYNLQSLPAVNMTHVSTKMLLEKMKEIEKIILLHKFRSKLNRGFRMMRTNPQAILEKISFRNARYY